MQEDFKSQSPKMEARNNFAVAHAGSIFETVNWEDGHGLKLEAVRRSPGARLMIETEKDGMKALLMTREIRREANGYDIRLPGGKVFDSLKDFQEYEKSRKDILPVAEAAAKKEGKEEAGISGGEYSLFEVSKAGASVEWDLFYFRVVGAEIGEQELEKGEMGKIETITLSAKEIFEKLSKREIKEGRSADMLWRWLNENGFIKFA